MALHEELDQRLEERLALVEKPDYEGEPMTRGTAGAKAQFGPSWRL